LTAIFAQETDPELAAYNAMLAEYGKTGLELFVYYPISLHLPGWSYPSVNYDWSIANFNLPGPNLSLAGLGMGLEIDFGSRKRVLRNMGFGGNLEFSSLNGWNMRKDVDLTLILSYLYLYYKTDFKKMYNYSISGGIGIGRVRGGEALFSYPEEKEDTAGPLYTVETAVILPPVGNFRFQAGIAYRFLAINTKNIHIISPMIRGGIRF